MLSERARPRLAPGVRTQHDGARGAWVVQAPERLVYPDEAAMAVLARCDGSRTVAEIVAEVAQEHGEAPAVLEDDIHELLEELMAHGVLTDGGP